MTRYVANDLPMIRVVLMSDMSITPVSATPVSKPMLWAGRILSLLLALLLLMSGIMKLVRPPEVVEGFTKLGYSDGLAVGIGIVELVCTVLYVIPRTSVLGAILLTGYLGGATATHLRVGDPYVMPIILGIVLWLGLYLRDPRLRALIPIKRSPVAVS